MKYYNPTLTYIEKNCVSNHEKELCSLGKSAFIITGKSSSRNGSLQDITSILEKNDIPYIIFDEVEENPSSTTCYRASRIGLEFHADFVIGIGGGSPLDASKAISLLMKNPDMEEDDLLVKKEDLQTYPIVAIPTTCGTGSEVTGVAVLCYHKQKLKGSMPHIVFPSLSLVDGKYILNAPRQLLINTSIDALSHALESYLNTKANVYNRMFSKYALELWKECKDILTKETLTLEDCHHLMLTSTIAGMAISQTGTSIPHFLGYDFTYVLNIPHGLACGIFQVAYLKEYAKHDQETISTILNLLGFKDINEFESYFYTYLPKVSATKEDIERFLEKTSSNQGKLTTFPFSLKKEDLQSIYTNSVHVE